MHVRNLITRSRAARLGVVLSVTAAAVIGTASPSFAAPGTLAIQATRGPSGGGNTITAKLTAGSTGTFSAGAVAVEFSATATCDATDWDAPTTVTQTGGAVNAGIVNVPDANVTVVSTTELDILVPATLALPAGATSGAFYVCIYPDRASAALIGGTATAVYNIDPQPLMTLSAYNGPVAGGNTITATAPSNLFVAGNIFAEFQYDGCSLLWKAAVTPASTGTSLSAGIVLAPSVKQLSGSKLAVTVPTMSLGGLSSTARYYLCVYDDDDTTNGDLIAQSATYTVATGSTITTIVPAAGSAQGGSVLTITGTYFTGATAVTIAGAPAASFSVYSPTTILATVPPHSAGGPFAVAVTTPSGTVIKTAAFTYTNGIGVTPNTAPNTSVTGADVDVQGVGFAGLDFSGSSGTTPDNAKAHVYLAKGAYNAALVGTSTTLKTNPQVVECVGVLVVDDNELICTLYLGGVWANGDPTTAALSRTVSTTIAAATLSTLTSTTAVFTSADIGQYVSGTSVPAATIITAVGTDGKTATLSKPATAAVTTAATYTITSQRAVADVATTSGNKDVVTTAGLFAASDVGKGIKGTGIPVGATIVSLSTDFKTATLSVAASATSGGTPVTLTTFPMAPVPIGTYTLTVVSSGAPGAQATAGYSQSIISSGSTFTVADY